MTSKNSALLRVEAVQVKYSQLTALRGVSLQIGSGEVVCVIGPNGAGKSTLMAAIAGGVMSAAGAIHFEGQKISGLSAEKVARAGISLVPEGRRIFSSLTVDENLHIGGYLHGDRGAAAQDFDRVLGYFPRLKERLQFPAGQLSGGEQQMLAVGRALMTRSKLILVDEPSLGLAPRIVDQIYEILLDMRQREGLTLMINEQSSNRILKHADRIYVLRNGQVQLEGRGQDLQDGHAIKEAYFGFNEEPVQELDRG